MMAVTSQKRKVSGGFQSNLKRFKSEMNKLTEQPGNDAETEPSYQKASGLIPLTRKEKRKELRKLKKMRRNAYYKHLPMPSQETLEAEKVAKLKADEKKRKQREKRKRRRLKKIEEKRQQEEEEELKVQGLKEANKKDDRVIKELEKQLFMKKRKSKTKKLPQGFINDGLDYLLDVVDPEKLKTIFEEGGGDISAGMPLSDEEYGVPEEEERSDDENVASDDENVASDDESHDESEEDNSENEGVDTKKKKKSVRFEGEENLEGKKSSGKKGKKEPPDQFSGSDSEAESAEDDEESDDGESGEELGMESGGEEGVESDEEDVDLSEDDDESGEMNIESEEEDVELGGEAAESDEDSDNMVSGDKESIDQSSDHGEDDDGQDSVVGDKTGVEVKSKEVKKPGKSTNLVEDIYGRLRDKDGKIVQDSGPKTGGYIPPAKRLALATTSDAKKKLELERIKKQIKGLLNRLSEANLQSISNQIEEMFRQHSRAYLSETLTYQIVEACITPVLVPERLIMEQVALMSVLHVNVGTEVGATFLQATVDKFQELFDNSPQYGEAKEMNNTLVILSHLYNFKIIQSPLVFDIFEKFVDVFGERDIELILLMLKNVGFGLRKDDPESLKNLLVKVKDKASSLDTSNFEDKSRVNFMLEVMMAVRNNNMRKIPNYDQTPMEHLRKLIRQYTTGGSSVDYQLRISLQDLMNSEEKGRWWLVGSAWSGNDVTKPFGDDDVSQKPLSVPAVSQKILDLAAKQRMNTDIRRNIFCVIMTSEDFVDAFEKLLRLGLKNMPEKEIIHVIMDLCMQETPFNAFYAYLVQKFCEYHRRFQMTVQFFTWDKLKVLHETPESNIINLAKFLTHLISKGAMSLSIFKNVQFSELDKGVLLLMRTVLTQLLMDFDDRTVVEVFSRIARLSKLKAYHDGLKIFMQHFILRRKGKGMVNQQLKQRVELAEKTLNSGESSFKL